MCKFRVDTRKSNWNSRLSRLFLSKFPALFKPNFAVKTTKKGFQNALENGKIISHNAELSCEKVNIFDGGPLYGGPRRKFFEIWTLKWSIFEAFLSKNSRLSRLATFFAFKFPAFPAPFQIPGFSRLVSTLYIGHHSVLNRKLENENTKSVTHNVLNFLFPVWQTTSVLSIAAKFWIYSKIEVNI